MLKCLESSCESDKLKMVAAVSRLISEWIQGETGEREDEEAMLPLAKQASTNSAQEILQQNPGAKLVPFGCDNFTKFIRHLLRDNLMAPSQSTEIYSTLLEVLG